MPKYSRGHEREEVAKMWKGFWHSTFGIVFCWVPGLGLLLSISGFARQVVRMTEKYKKRWLMLMAYGLLSLALSIGVIVAGLYQYVHNPNFFKDIGRSAWKTLTGQETLPGEAPVTDYSKTGQSGGLGVYTENEDDGVLDNGDEDGELLDEYDPELDGEGDTVPDAETGDGAALPSLDELQGKNAGADGDEPIPDEGPDDDLDDEEYTDDEDFYEFDFTYEVVDDSYLTEGESERVIYKVVIDTATPTDEDLKALYDEVVYEDGYDLHTMLVYKADSETEGNYTVAQMKQDAVDGQPVLTRK